MFRDTAFDWASPVCYNTIYRVFTLSLSRVCAFQFCWFFFFWLLRLLLFQVSSFFSLCATSDCEYVCLQNENQHTGNSKPECALFLLVFVFFWQIQVSVTISSKKRRTKEETTSTKRHREFGRRQKHWPSGLVCAPIEWQPAKIGKIYGFRSRSIGFLRNERGEFQSHRELRRKKQTNRFVPHQDLDKCDGVVCAFVFVIGRKLADRNAERQCVSGIVASIDEKRNVIDSNERNQMIQ